MTDHIDRHAQEPDAEPEATRVSDKQVRANRMNARRSTGPTTSKGKARSATNATTHGIYARASAITAGEFAEDPNEIDRITESIVADLKPRDAVETFAARRVADAWLHALRVGRYTAVRYAQVATVTVLEAALVGSADSTSPDQEQIAARKLFTEALDQGTVLDARVGREIQRSIDTYAKLRKRPIAGLNSDDDSP